MPDAAHSHGGVATLNAGSSTTTLGASRGSTMACFTRVRSSVMPATAVNSPAESVVGTATCGRPRPACGAEAQQAVHGGLGRVDRAAAAEAHDAIGAMRLERLRQAGHRRRRHVLAGAGEHVDAARAERAR